MGKNIVEECFAHERGYPPPQEGQTGVDRWRQRDYMDWCEAKAAKWRELFESFGYTRFTHEIKTLHGSITYHEWLKKEVGL